MLTHRKVRRPGFWLLVACVAVSGAVVVTAAPRGDRPDRPRARQQRAPMFGILRDLDLSDEQKAEVKAILEKAKQKRQAVMAEHKEELDKINEQIRKLVEQRKKLLAGAPDRKELAKQISDVLTPEQQEEFSKRLEAMKPRPRTERKDRPNRRGRERPVL